MKLQDLRRKFAQPPRERPEPKRVAPAPVAKPVTIEEAITAGPYCGGCGKPIPKGWKWCALCAASKVERKSKSGLPLAKTHCGDCGKPLGSVHICAADVAEGVEEPVPFDEAPKPVKAKRVLTPAKVAPPDPLVDRLRRFETKAKDSRGFMTRKFWHIKCYEQVGFRKPWRVDLKWGKFHTAGVKKSLQFSTKSEAVDYYIRAIVKKLHEGYEERTR